jgi:putative Mg2+ transporter-C (MgtC) family protein
VAIDFQLEALLRLVLAGISAGVLGIEREAADKPAGMRTFAVVGIGSCLFTLTAIQAFDGQDDAVSRVTAQIVTGIGFLGAGTIIQVRDTVHGLTTAAGIWAVAAVGVAYGSGLYVLAVGTTVLLLVFIAVVGRVMPTPKRIDDDAERGANAGPVGT